MSEAERAAIKELGEKTHAWFVALSDAEKIECLKRSGILDRSGKLSSSYGGDGEPTRGGDQPVQASASR